MPAAHVETGKPAGSQAGTRKEFEEVQYIPESRERKWPLEVSIEDNATGEVHTASLHPRRWTKVHWTIAEMLESKMKRGREATMVPNGDGFDENAGSLQRAAGAEQYREEDSQGFDVVFKDR